MASGKLDQSLDEILSTTRRANRTRATRSGGNRSAPAAPAGGIQKGKGRNAAKPAPAKGSSGVVGESKIVVSNLVSYSPNLFHDKEHTLTCPSETSRG